VPNHERLNEACTHYKELVGVLHRLEPGSLSPVREAYCAAINALLRREVRDYIHELRARSKAQVLAAAEASGTGGGGVSGRARRLLINATRRAPHHPHAHPAGTRVGSPSVSSMDSQSQSGTELGPRSLSSVGSEETAALFNRPDTSFVAEAYAHFLAAFVPLLAKEAGLAREFLFPQTSSPTRKDEDTAGRATNLQLDLGLEEGAEPAAERVLAGVQDEVFKLVDWCVRLDELLSVPMLMHTGIWMESSEARAGGTAVTAVLAGCQSRLRRQFAKWCEERVVKIRLKTERAASQAAVVAGVGGRRAEAAKEMRKWTHLLATLDKLSTPQPAGTLSQSEGRAHLEDVDGAIAMIATALFKMINKMAAADSKHQDIVSLLNYNCFLESAENVGEHTKPVLRDFVSSAEERFKAAHVHYVERVVNKFFGVLLNFVDRVGKHCKRLTPEEVPFQVGCAVGDFRKIMRDTTSLAEKSITQMHKKVVSNLGAGTPICRKVWESCRGHVISKYTELEKLAKKCYPSESSTMAPAGQLLELFKMV